MPMLQLRYSDNNGETAQHIAHLPDGLSAVGRVSFINAIAVACEAITTSRLEGAEYVTKYIVDRPVNPDFPQSDVFSRLVLFFRNGNNWDFVRIPAASGTLPYDIGGAYGSRRLTSDSVLGSSRFAPLLALIPDMLSRNGTPFPNQFVVGCRTRG